MFNGDIMSIIDESQNIALELLGLLFIIISGLNLIGLNVPILNQWTYWEYMIMLVIGIILSGYKAIPKRIIDSFRALK